MGAGPVDQSDQGIGPALPLGESVPVHAQGVRQGVQRRQHGFALYPGQVRADHGHPAVTCRGQATAVPISVFLRVAVVRVQVVEGLGDQDLDAFHGHLRQMLPDGRQEVLLHRHGHAPQASRDGSDHVGVDLAGVPQLGDDLVSIGEARSGQERGCRAPRPACFTLEVGSRGVRQGVATLGDRDAASDLGLDGRGDPGQGSDTVGHSGAGHQIVREGRAADCRDCLGECDHVAGTVRRIGQQSPQ